MRVDRQTLLFFDAACLMAAAGRPAGGSGFLLQLCHHDLLRGAVSPIVLWEAETNIVAKLPPAALATFHRLIATTRLMVTPAPSAMAVADYQTRVNAKDAHVVAAAMAVNAPYLLSLDRRFLRELGAAQLDIRGLTPGEFISQVLPTHPDGARLRG